MKKKLIATAVVGAVIAAIAGASASVAFAAEPNGSAEKYYLVDNIEGTAITAGSTVGFSQGVSASPVADNSNFDQKFTGPVGATSVRTFISPRGSELIQAQWNASANSAFNSGTTVLMPSANLSNFTTPNGAQTPGTNLAVKAAGGSYSIGLAYLSGSTVLAASYTYIVVTPATGAWTFDTPAGVVTPPPAGTSFDANLSATTVAAQDGALSIVAPTNLNVAIGNPTLVNGLSVSTGTLGQFSVQDNRVVSHLGWNLTMNVADFTNGSVTIGKTQLGIKPILVAAGSQAGGVTLAPEQVAGSATYQSLFASAANNATVGTTNFNADLKFIAPVSAAAGVYTSTLTLTVVSK